MANSLGDLIVKIGADISDYVDKMGKASAQMQRMGSNMQSIGGKMSAAITLPIVGLGVAALKAAGDLEQNQIAFTTMLKSADSARSMLGKLSDLAAQSPFELTDTVTGARRLLAMGTAAKDVIPTLRSISNAVSASAGGAEGLQRVTLAIGQMGAKGKVTGDEMRQLTEAGVNAWKYIADSMHKSVPEIMKLAEKGAIDSKTGIAAILKGFDTEFAGSMEAQSKTFLGQLSMLKDGAARTLAEVGTVLIPSAKSMLAAVQPILDTVLELAKAFAKLPVPVQNATIGLLALAAAAGPLVFVSGALIRSTGEVLALFKLIGGTAGAGMVATLKNIGAAAVIASAAFVGWKLGEWLRENIPLVKAFGDSFADGMVGLSRSVSGESGKTIAAWNALEKKAADTASLLAVHGVTVQRGSMSIEEYSSALLKAAAGVKGFGESHDKPKAIVIDLAAALKTAKEQVSLLSEAQSMGAVVAGKMKEAHLAERDAFFALHPELVKSHVAYDALTGKLKQFRQETLDAALAVVALDKKQADSVSQGPFLPHLTKMGAAMKQISYEAPKIEAGLIGIGSASDLVASATMQVTFGVISISEAFKTLGMESTEALKIAASNAAAAFEVIKNSGTSSWNAITQAAITAEKAAIAYAQRMGKDVAGATITVKDAQNELDKETGKLTTTHQTATQKMSKGMQAVSTAVTDLSRGIADAIVHFKSLADVGVKVAQSLASAVIQILIEGALAKLGAKLIQLGGMWAKLGTTLGGTAASAGASAAGSAGASVAGSAAGSAAGGIGSAVGSVGGAAASAGVTAVVGAVAGVVGAVSSIIGNFQMMAMNKSLDLIEANTRFTQIGIIGPGGMLDRLNTYLPGVVGIQDRLIEVRGALFAPVASTLEGIYDRLGGGKGGGGMTLNFYGVTDPRQMAEKIVASMKMAGVRV